ncbi:MAG TPA: ECF-type sigma factor [Gemmatimonadaceae bacterium]|nr:ECF-type sigma factor [Gemmatimonadaceae bacterium]
MLQLSDRVKTPTPRVEPSHVDALFGQVYGELKGLAHRVRSARGRGSTFDTTALVHEAYLKLAAADNTPWKNESHFFAIAARAMRQILVDVARERLAEKRGGADPVVMTYDDGAHAAPVRPDELIALDEALARLAAFDPRRALVIEHRVFAGLSIPETARLLDISTATVERDWRAARAWLTLELARGQTRA